VRFEALTAVAINITAIWDVVPCTLVYINALEAPDSCYSLVTSSRLYVITFRKTRHINSLEVSEMLHADTMRPNMFILCPAREERIKITSLVGL
jgi:hypothetical protein